MATFFFGFCLGVVLCAAIGCAQNRMREFDGTPRGVRRRIEARRREASAAQKVERRLEESRRGGGLIRRYPRKVG